MNIWQFWGLVTFIFGILIITFPALLGYLVGGLFVVVGLNVLIFGTKIKGSFRIQQ